MVLPGLDFRPQLVHHVLILGDLRGGGVLQHDAVQGGVDLLLDVLLLHIEAITLALAELLVRLAPKGSVQHPVHQDEVPLHGAAGNGPGVLDELLDGGHGEGGAGQLASLLPQVEDVDDVKGVDVGCPALHQLGDGIIEIAVLLHGEVVRGELLGVEIELRMENEGGDDTGFAGYVADVADVHEEFLPLFA